MAQRLSISLLTWIRDWVPCCQPTLRSKYFATLALSLSWRNYQRVVPLQGRLCIACESFNRTYRDGEKEREER